MATVRPCLGAPYRRGVGAGRSYAGGVQRRSHVTAWVTKLEPAESVKDSLGELFDKYVPDTLPRFMKNTKVQVPLVDIALVSAVCSLLTALVPPNCEALELWFVLSNFEGVDYRKQFIDWWKVVL